MATDPFGMLFGKSGGASGNPLASLFGGAGGSGGQGGGGMNPLSMLGPLGGIMQQDPLMQMVGKLDPMQSLMGGMGGK